MTTRYALNGVHAVLAVHPGRGVGVIDGPRYLPYTNVSIEVVGDHEDARLELRWQANKGSGHRSFRRSCGHEDQDDARGDGNSAAARGHGNDRDGVQGDAPPLLLQVPPAGIVSVMVDSHAYGLASHNRSRYDANAAGCHESYNSNGDENEDGDEIEKAASGAPVAMVTVVMTDGPSASDGVRLSPGVAFDGLVAEGGRVTNATVGPLAGRTAATLATAVRQMVWSAAAGASSAGASRRPSHIDFVPENMYAMPMFAPLESTGTDTGVRTSDGGRIATLQCQGYSKAGSGHGNGDGVDSGTVSLEPHTPERLLNVGITTAELHDGQNPPPPAVGAMTDSVDRDAGFNPYLAIVNASPLGKGRSLGRGHAALSETVASSCSAESSRVSVSPLYRTTTTAATGHRGTASGADVSSSIDQQQRHHHNHESSYQLERLAAWSDTTSDRLVGWADCGGRSGYRLPRHRLISAASVASGADSSIASHSNYGRHSGHRGSDDGSLQEDEDSEVGNMRFDCGDDGVDLSCQLPRWLPARPRVADDPQLATIPPVAPPATLIPQPEDATPATVTPPHSQTLPQQTVEPTQVLLTATVAAPASVPVGVVNTRQGASVASPINLVKPSRQQQLLQRQLQKPAVACLAVPAVRPVRRRTGADPLSSSGSSSSPVESIVSDTRPQAGTAAAGSGVPAALSRFISPRSMVAPSGSTQPSDRRPAIEVTTTMSTPRASAVPAPHVMANGSDDDVLEPLVGATRLAGYLSKTPVSVPTTTTVASWRSPYIAATPKGPPNHHQATSPTTAPKPTSTAAAVMAARVPFPTQRQPPVTTASATTSTERRMSASGVAVYMGRPARGDTSGMAVARHGPFAASNPDGDAGAASAGGGDNDDVVMRPEGPVSRGLRLHSAFKASSMLDLIAGAERDASAARDGTLDT